MKKGRCRLTKQNKTKQNKTKQNKTNNIRDSHRLDEVEAVPFFFFFFFFFRRFPLAEESRFLNNGKYLPMEDNLVRLIRGYHSQLHQEDNAPIPADRCQKVPPGVELRCHANTRTERSANASHRRTEVVFNVPEDEADEVGPETHRDESPWHRRVVTQRSESECRERKHHHGVYTEEYGWASREDIDKRREGRDKKERQRKVRVGTALQRKGSHSKDGYWTLWESSTGRAGGRGEDEKRPEKNKTLCTAVKQAQLTNCTMSLNLRHHFPYHTRVPNCACTTVPPQHHSTQQKKALWPVFVFF